MQYLMKMVLIGLLALPVWGLQAQPQPLKLKQSSKQLSAITMLVVKFVSTQHYDKKPLDAAMADAVFQEYLKTLDPGKMYFLQSDIAHFQKYKAELAQNLQRGNTDFAFDAFNLLLTRQQEFAACAEELLKRPFNFSVDETYEFDRTDAAWMTSMDELKNLWRQRIKNDILNMLLVDRAAKEEEKEQPEKAGKKAEPRNSVSAWTKKSPPERVMKRIEQVCGYYNELEPIEVLELFLSTLTRVYDPHSAYMSPRTGKDFDISMKLSLVGIGAVLTNEDGYTKVVEIIPGGPAELDGRLQPEDRIIAVQQENEEPVDVIDMPLSKVVDKIRGTLGTQVSLTILEGKKGRQAIPKQIALKRNKVVIKDSEAKGAIRDIKSADGRTRKIGVITVPSFYLDFDAARRGDPDFKSSTRDVARILRDFNEKHVEGVVIDLRSNGGGSLWEAIMLTGLFIIDGPVVQVRDRDGIQVKNDEDNGAIAWEGPMAVMINRLSASASEIFAAAISDHKRGVIVGDQKTHGKGTVQMVSDLDRYMPFVSGEKFSAGSIKLTNAKFYRINGASTQLKGVTPDISFPSFTDSMELGEEKLDHALPWDTVRPVRYTRFDPALPLILPQLKERSAARIQASPEFKVLKSDIEAYDKIKKRKSVSLSMEKRWQEYLNEKNLQEEQSKLLRLKDSGNSKDAKNSKEENKDLYLEETLSIMNDFIDLSGR